MSRTIDGLELMTWEAGDLARAVRRLAQAAGLAAQEQAQAPEPGLAGEDVSGWLAAVGTSMGVEVVAVETTIEALEDMLRRLGPALLRIGDGDEACYLAVVAGGRWGLSLLRPDGERRWAAVRTVHDALVGEVLAPVVAETRGMMSGLDLAWAIDEDGLRALARERVHALPVDRCWLVRTSPGAPLGRQIRATGAPLLLGLMLVTRVASVALTLGLWKIVGGALLAGDVSAEAIGAASMCLISLAPLAVLDTWTQGRLALEAGAQLKEALLFGVLRLDRGATRAFGIGRFMSMAMEGEVASTAMESVLRMIAAAVDLAAAVVVLLLGAEGEVLAPMLVVWVAMVVWLCRRHAVAAGRWAAAYRDVTHDLVERMVGYQTRLIQEPPELRHLDEDALLHGYVTASQAVDRNSLVMHGVVRTGWLLLGLAALAPGLLAGTATAATAVAFGGVLLVAGALQRVVGGVAHLVAGWVSWQQTAPIFAAGRASGLRDETVLAEPPRPTKARPADAPLLQFSGLSVRHDPRRAEAVRGCAQTIAAGDRILLAGSSGSGKSTLATVLAGLRRPDRGELRLMGQRRDAVIDEWWRRRVVLVPQFHDNHVLSESLLFNLLIGRSWPPAAADVRDAAAVCELIGLTPLLRRMPQGLQQTVGDGGWALSHGERSRVFLARALLQRGVALVILDESFAALDPETLRQIGGGVMAAAPTLLVIAHP